MLHLRRSILPSPSGTPSPTISRTSGFDSFYSYRTRATPNEQNEDEEKVAAMGYLLECSRADGQVVRIPREQVSLIVSATKILSAGDKWDELKVSDGQCRLVAEAG